MQNRDEIYTERARLKSQYGDLYALISEILFLHDPIGINFGSNIDEYDPEVRTILPSLVKCTNIQDIKQIIHEEFTSWFSADLAGSESQYQKIAEEIWLILIDSSLFPLASDDKPN